LTPEKDYIFYLCEGRVLALWGGTSAGQWGGGLGLGDPSHSLEQNIFLYRKKFLYLPKVYLLIARVWR